MASLFVLPFRPAFDSNSKTIPGAQAWFTLPGTNTPTTVYADAGLTTPLANPVVANSVGRWPAIYLNDGLSYRARIYDEDATVGVDTALEDYDPYDNLYLGAVEAVYHSPLIADTNYYVRTDGNDANTGLTNTAGGAFLTIQGAIDAIYSSRDLAGFVATINVADGTYGGSIQVAGRPIGAWSTDAPIRIIGNEVTPANVIITSGADYTLEVRNNAHVFLAGVTVKNTGNTGILVQDWAVLEHQNCILGPVVDEVILARHHAVVRATGPTTATGNATNFIHATKRSIIDFTSQTLTFSGAPVYSNYLWGINDASINIDSATIVGTATGRIVVHDNGILNASSLTGSYLGGTAPEVDDEGIIAVKDKMETRTFYVRTDGNDANDGLANTAGRAFKTIQGAVNAVAKLPYNPVAFLAGGGITISVASGTYNETVTLRDIPYALGIIVGDETTPANVVVQGVSDGFAAIKTKTPWYIRGMRVHATAGYCMRGEHGGSVIFRKIEFGSATISHIGALGHGRMIGEGAYSIVSAAPRHLRAYMNAFIDINGQTVTITGTPAFSTAFATVDLCAVVKANSVTFSGSATGTRYAVTLNGVIDTSGGGATYLPGNAAGSTATGGQYN